MSSEAASTRQKSKVRQAIGEGPKTRMVLIAVSLGFLGLMLIAPLLVVFVEAFSRGLGVYFDALALPDTMAALQLTLLVAAIAVPANLVFGVAAAWLNAARRKRSKSGISLSGSGGACRRRPTKALSTFGGGTNEPGRTIPSRATLARAWVNSEREP